MDFKVIYEDENLLVVDKPAGITVAAEGEVKGKTLINYLLEKYPFLAKTGSPPRYGIVHRLDKETSGILLIAKNNEALYFFQRQFKERKVIKKYVALVAGKVKEEDGVVKTLFGRTPGDSEKRKVYLPFEPGSERKKEAITLYQVLKRFANYTLVKVIPKTGRTHQIRVHLAYLHHPIAGDKLYSFKDQISPSGLKRQFLHAYYLKIRLLDNEVAVFKSDLPEELKNVIKNL